MLAVVSWLERLSGRPEAPLLTVSLHCNEGTGTWVPVELRGGPHASSDPATSRVITSTVSRLIEGRQFRGIQLTNEKTGALVVQVINRFADEYGRTLEVYLLSEFPTKVQLLGASGTIADLETGKEHVGEVLLPPGRYNLKILLENSMGRGNRDVVRPDKSVGGKQRAASR